MRWDPLQRLHLVYQGGGSPPSQTTSTQVNQLYSPEEAARRAAVMSEAERIYQQARGQVGNAAPVGPSADTLQSQNLARSVANNNPLAAFVPQLQQGMQFGMSDVLDPTKSPGFNATLDTALRRVGTSYTDPGGVFSNIRSGFTGNNTAGSGTREGIAMGMAGREYLNTVGDVTGKLTSDAYTKGLDVFSRTMALAPQTAGAIQGASMLPSNIIGGIGQQNEAYQEQERQWNLQSPWAAFGPYAQTVMAGSGPSGTTSSSTMPAPQQNQAMTSAGMAMMGAAMFPAHPFLGAGAGLALSLFM